MAFFWRRLTIATHRDLGYALLALIIIYSVSGIAVNHIEDWNPNYRRSVERREIGPLADLPQEAQVGRAAALLGVGIADVKNSFRPDAETLQLFVEASTFSIDLPTGKVIVEATRRRPVLFEFNQLHLNHIKGIWTYVADLFAVALILLAVTGLFIVKGQNGPLRRGKWFVIGGIAIPAIFWALTLVEF